jgi:hypothetical protein
MGISNYKPNSRLAQAGVVPNAAARPASPYEGQVIFQVDTKRTLVWDGAGWVDLSTGTVNQPGLELVTSCTATFTGGTAGSVSNGVVTVGSANTAVEISNAFSANYDNYKITYSGGNSTATTGGVNMRLGSSTASYFSGAIYAIYAGSSNVIVTNNGSNWTFVGGIDTNTGNNVDIDVFNPFNSSRFTAFGGPFFVADVAGSTGGVHKVNASYSSFIFFPNAGSITGGKIRVYGYRN